MVPVRVSAQSGLVFRTNFAETVCCVTVPAKEPPDVPSHVKVPESDEPLWVMAMVILQPAVICSQPVRAHEPDASTGAVGAVVGEQADNVKAATNSRQTYRIG
jgi:hypothetical protein